MADFLRTIPHTLDGFLLQWRMPRMRSGALADHSDLLDEFHAIPEFKPLDLGATGRGWFAFEVSSKTPLQPNFEPSDLGLYRYFLLLRIQATTGTVVVATASRNLTRAIIDQFINRYLRPNLQPIQLLTSELSSQLVEDPESGFKMTSLSGDFIYDGSDVRVMILYGDDLGNSRFVQDNIGAIMPNQVGMRERTSMREDARVGSAGTLRFYFREGEGLRSLEKCLAFMLAKKIYVYPAS
ncbi:hypothetical protein [Agrobacterium sp. lyk4-40-TYG-31]|uniref:hypothetical protein n=1 Tax=Agrobacterium sp. lyk4-40-TYG-31 TaxID=3040276 RepID=UPI00254A0720|nr:hypothetical protein [Agrobacterium sp. lyk4-40-TYG-31]